MTLPSEALIKDKMFRLGEKFAKKFIESFDEDALITFAVEQYRRQMQFDRRISIDTFDQDGLMTDICTFFGELDIEVQYYRENDFSDEEIEKIIGEETFTQLLEDKNND
jgi:hypothetical protein